MREVDYSEQQLNLFTDYGQEQENQGSSCGKMFPALSAAITDGTFRRCSRKSDRPTFQCLNLADGQQQEWSELKQQTSHGECSTLNIGECPSVANASSLSQILQAPDDVPTKYYLSPRACQGILRRARERGKELPAELKAALERQSMGFAQ